MSTIKVTLKEIHITQEHINKARGPDTPIALAVSDVLVDGSYVMQYFDNTVVIGHPPSGQVCNYGLDEVLNEWTNNWRAGRKTMPTLLAIRIPDVLLKEIL